MIGWLVISLSARSITSQPITSQPIKLAKIRGEVLAISQGFLLSPLSFERMRFCAAPENLTDL